MYPNQISVASTLQDAWKLQLATIYLVRAKAFLAKKNYDKSWSDVRKAESLKGDIFLKWDKERKQIMGNQ